MELNTAILTTPPLDAATVVMLRDGPGGLQVLLMRRHQASNVLGGAYVFPGGKLDLDDQNPAWLQRLSQDSATLHQRLNEPDIPGERAAGLFVAAMREAYEECRVLLGCAPHAEPQAQALLHALRSGQRAASQVIALHSGKSLEPKAAVAAAPAKAKTAEEKPGFFTRLFN